MADTHRPDQAVADAAGRIIDLEAELEAAGNALTGADPVAIARASLHEWVDTVVGVVTSPGVGRVTLIHANGKQTKIASSELPYLLSAPVRFDA